MGRLRTDERKSHAQAAISTVDERKRQTICRAAGGRLLAHVRTCRGSRPIANPARGHRRGHERAIDSIRGSQTPARGASTQFQKTTGPIGMMHRPFSQRVVRGAPDAADRPPEGSANSLEFKSRVCGVDMQPARRVARAAPRSSVPGRGIPSPPPEAALSRSCSRWH
jgi:hypothetical protein